MLDRLAKIDQFEKPLDYEEPVDVYEKLSNLEKDFVYTASNILLLSSLLILTFVLIELYGRVIISEQYQTTKTIQPVNVGGIAGGTKYIVNGITIPALSTPLVNFI